MRKFLITVLVCFLLTGFLIFDQDETVHKSSPEERYRIYFVDRQLHRLIPVPFTPETTPEKTAEKVIDELILGRDSVTSILRLIPNDQECMSVRIENDTACVDLSGSLRAQINKNAETEKLFIYQIVNSLTSVDGIDKVRFLIDGNKEKSFIGFLDMREIFTPNYDI